MKGTPTPRNKAADKCPPMHQNAAYQAMVSVYAAPPSFTPPPPRKTPSQSSLSHPRPRLKYRWEEPGLAVPVEITFDPHATNKSRGGKGGRAGSNQQQHSARQHRELERLKEIRQEQQKKIQQAKEWLQQRRLPRLPSATPSLSSSLSSSLATLPSIHPFASPSPAVLADDLDAEPRGAPPVPSSGIVTPATEEAIVEAEPAPQPKLETETKGTQVEEGELPATLPPVVEEAGPAQPSFSSLLDIAAESGTQEQEAGAPALSQTANDPEEDVAAPPKPAEEEVVATATLEQDPEDPVVPAPEQEEEGPVLEETASPLPSPLPEPDQPQRHQAHDQRRMTMLGERIEARSFVRSFLAEVEEDILSNLEESDFATTTTTTSNNNSSNASSAAVHEVPVLVLNPQKEEEEEKEEAAAYGLVLAVEAPVEMAAAPVEAEVTSESLLAPEATAAVVHEEKEQEQEQEQEQQQMAVEEETAATVGTLVEAPQAAVAPVPSSTPHTDEAEESSNIRAVIKEEVLPTLIDRVEAQQQQDGAASPSSSVETVSAPTEEVVQEPVVATEEQPVPAFPLAEEEKEDGAEHKGMEEQRDVPVSALSAQEQETLEQEEAKVPEEEEEAKEV